MRGTAKYRQFAAERCIWFATKAYPDQVRTGIVEEQDRHGFTLTDGEFFPWEGLKHVYVRPQNIPPFQEYWQHRFRKHPMQGLANSMHR